MRIIYIYPFALVVFYILICIVFFLNELLITQCSGNMFSGFNTVYYFLDLSIR